MNVSSTFVYALIDVLMMMNNAKALFGYHYHLKQSDKVDDDGDDFRWMKVKEHRDSLHLNHVLRVRNEQHQ